MPSTLSLRENQYYGNPLNSFWFIMSALTGVAPDQPYSRRVAGLLDQHIAVWDVVYRCKREGSLDAAIEQDSIITNDFGKFFTAHPRIEQVLFNGATAEREFQRRARPLLSADINNMHYQRLPSTSPAMASLTRQQKQALWLAALNKS